MASYLRFPADKHLTYIKISSFLYSPKTCFPNAFRSKLITAFFKHVPGKFNTSSFLKQESGLPNMENHSEIIKMKLLDKPLTMCFHNLNLTFVAVFKLSNRKELLWFSAASLKNSPGETQLLCCFFWQLAAFLSCFWYLPVPGLAPRQTGIPSM